MSRTYKDTGHQYRIIKNSLYKKHLHLWSEDFGHRRKDRTISRHLRKKLTRNDKKDIDNYSILWYIYLINSKNEKGE